MAQIKFIDGGVTAPQGFTANGIHCGIRQNKTKRDLSLIFSEKKANAAAVYTTNLVKGAPLVVTMHIIVEYGTNISVIANNVISTVKYTLEDAVGLEVEQINVFVEGVRVDGI